MRFASLFAGCGGFDLGFERAGMTCVGQVELDPHCRQVLAEHWPEVPRWEDIHDVTAEGLRRGFPGRVRYGPPVDDERRVGVEQEPVAGRDGRTGGGSDPDLGSVDVLVGGFPCQDYSVAGLRGGLAGDRGALWWQFHRLIAECRPQWVVGENVPGLLSSNGGRDFGAIVGSLVELGYGVVWRVLDAQYFGVAQRRRRVLVVGHSGGVPRPEVLDLAQGCAWDPPPRREAGKGIAALTANGLGGGGPDDNLAQAGHLIDYLPDTAGSLRQTDHKAPTIDIAEPSLIAFNWQPGQDQLSARESHVDALHAGQVPAVAFAQNQRDEIRQLDVSSLNAERWGTAKNETLLAQPVSVREDQRTGAVYEMPYTSALASAGGKPGQGYQAVREGSSVRRLTPLECERLQGFPDGWTAGQKDTQRYRQMGNAVAVPVAEWVGRRIMEAR